MSDSLSERGERGEGGMGVSWATHLRTRGPSAPPRRCPDIPDCRASGILRFDRSASMGIVARFQEVSGAMAIVPRGKLTLFHAGLHETPGKRRFHTGRV